MTPRSIQDQSHSGCEDEAGGGTRSGADDETVSLIDVLQRDLDEDGIAEVPQETAASQRSTLVVLGGIAPRRPRTVGSGAGVLRGD